MAETRMWPGRDDVDPGLKDLGPIVAFPPTPDLARSVAADLARPVPTPSPPSWRRPSRPWRWSLGLAAAALLVVASAFLALVPAARFALGETLGVAGVRIFRIDADPTVSPTPVGGNLGLGRRLTLAKAASAVPYPIAVPTLAGFADPDEVYLARVPTEGMVSFVYRPRSGLPESPTGGVGALLTQFPGRTDDPVAEKGVGPAATVEPVEIRDGHGFWIEGEAHLFVYRDIDGEPRYEEYRLAGNVLLWDENGVTYRLESALDKERAISIARSLRVRDRTG